MTMKSNLGCLLPQRCKTLFAQNFLLMNSNLAVSQLACMNLHCMLELTSKRLQDMLQNTQDRVVKCCIKSRENV